MIILSFFSFFNRTITNINVDDADENADIDEATTANEVFPLKRRRSSSNGDQMKIFENIAHSIKENNSKRNEIIQKMINESKPETELELYFGAICKTVSKFSALEQAKIKMKFNNIVSETEMAYLERIESNIINANFEHFETISIDDGTTYVIKDI